MSNRIGSWNEVDNIESWYKASFKDERTMRAQGIRSPRLIGDMQTLALYPATEDPSKNYTNINRLDPFQ